MKRLLGFLLALMLLWPCAVVATDENLIENGGFEKGFDAWGMTAWSYGEVYTSFDVVQQGEDGGNCALVWSHENNDARFEQFVSLEKNTLYHLSAKVKFEGEGSLNLSLLDTRATSAYVHDTGGEWTTLELYFRTDKKYPSALVALRVGNYGRLENGKAWFDDVALVKADEAPEGMEVYSAATNPPTKPGVDAPDKAGLSAVVFAALFTLAALILYSIAARGAEWEKRRAYIVLGGILGVAFAVRAYIAYKVPGYEVDINCFGLWGARLASVGPGRFYLNDYMCDYPPGYMPVLALISAVTQALGLNFADPPGQLLLKLPAILCDLGTCYLLFHIAKKSLSSYKWGLVAAALYAACPAIIGDSAAWGQVDSVLTFFIALSLFCMIERKMLPASLLFCIALLIKPQALMFGPILLLAFIHEIKLDPQKGFADLGICFAVCAAVFVAVVLPFNGGRNPVWILGKYFSTITSYPHATVNAMNLFAMMGENWQPQTDMLGPLSFQTWGTIFMVVTIAYAMFLYIFALWKGNADRRALLISALVLLAGIFCFGVRMHERYLYPALALALMAFLLYKDRRFLVAFLGLAVGQAINILVVLAHQHILDTDRFVMMLGGILHIVSALYLFYLGFSICVLGDRAKGVERFKPIYMPRRMVISVEQPDLRTIGGRDIRLRRIDVILMASVTLAYTALAFVNLGDTIAPETTFQASAPGETVVFDMGSTQEVSRFYYYGEIPEGSFQVSFAGEDERFGNPVSVQYIDNIMFIWKIVDINESARYAKIEYDTPGLTFFEFAFSGADGIPYPVSVKGHTGSRELSKPQDPKLLIDEQQLVPAHPTFMDSMYFDEIYHARTGYEQANDMPWYEVTHPPLGKVFMSWCIMAFGMNPFAWRLAGTIAGILMLPGMYMLGKVLFKRTELAFASMFLMAVDCMHLTQTRIATIDSFPVLFIIWAYFFMFLYANMSFHHEKLGRTLGPLFASGLFMGLACASKWIGFYAAAGLAVIFFYIMGKRFFEYREACKEIASGNSDPHLRRVKQHYLFNVTATLACCIGFFIAIPLAIYYASFYQYLAIPGANHTWRSVWKYQLNMFTYHAGVFDPHPYASTWYQWPVIWKPMAFYFDYRAQAGWSSSISTFGNPAVWWGGLAAIVWTIWRAIRGDSRRDPRILLVVLGFAAQYLPWVLVPRTTFIYHYFASVPFLILSIGFFLEKLLAKGRMKTFVVLLAVAGVLFALFYPVASGLTIPIDLAKLVNWFPSWNLYWR